MYNGRKNVESNCWFWSQNKTADYKNQYIYFKKEIEISDDVNNADICISVDTNYALWINGIFVDCGQYISYPHIKFYDKLDIKSYLKKGNNTFLILAYYEGLNSASYVTGKPGIFVEITIDNKIHTGSDGWLCSADTGYVNGDMYSITSQIGYGFKYNANLACKQEWSTVTICEHDTSLPEKIYERPVNKLLIKTKTVDEVNSSDKHFLVDLKKEVSGYFTFKLKSEQNTGIKITYGEYADVENNKIPPVSGDRNFCFYYVTGGGEEEFTHYIKKTACRYIQIDADKDIYLDYAGIIPTVYPVNYKKSFRPASVHGRIYDICMNTLLNCMHEKYEDTPWREQALYAQDGRNQALFGYCLFNNYEFPLACIKLLAESITKDGFVRITSPSAADRCIPYFSYMWVLMFADYFRYSGNAEEARKLLPAVKSLIDTHIQKYGRDGILCIPERNGIWNFYEWADGLDGAYYDENDVWCILPYNKERRDAIINMFFLISLRTYAEVLCELGYDTSEYEAYCILLTEKINDLFYNEERKMYCSYRTGNEQTHYCELTQALAILAGVCTDEVKAHILQTLLSDNNLVKTTLSCMMYKFDAILSADENMRSYVLNEIEKVFSPMLSGDSSGCCWETEKGKSDFQGSGSMCHGWSAFPVYFYYKFFGLSDDAEKQ